jgi:hypothetical protein
MTRRKARSRCLWQTATEEFSHLNMLALIYVLANARGVGRSCDKLTRMHTPFAAEPFCGCVSLVAPCYACTTL